MFKQNMRFARRTILALNLACVLTAFCQQAQDKLRARLPVRVNQPESNSDTPVGLTPAEIAKIYNVPSDRGKRTIAVVVPFHYENARGDLAIFSQTFNLRQCGENCFDIVPTAQTDCMWAREAALNLQWAHAMAPKARLLLVEAKSDQPGDLFAAVRVASRKIKRAGGGQIVMTWPICLGSNCEWSDETQFDSFFINGVVYFAATGDQGGVPSYPSTSPRVVAVGGTVPGDPGPDFEEDGWVNSGGGISKFEKRPKFQRGVKNIQKNARHTPDLAVDAGRSVAVFYTSTRECESQVPSGWQTSQNGTSAATPIVAGMANAAGSLNHSSTAELRNIYANREDPKRFRDIVVGFSGVVGSSEQNHCRRGYDLVTGVGAPLGSNFDAPPRRRRAKRHQ